MTTFTSEKSIKICIAQGPTLPVPPVRGGAVEKLWWRLGQSLAARGHNVVHISRQWADLPISQIKLGVRYERVSGFNRTAWRVLNLFFDLLYSIRICKLNIKSDILVTNTFFLPLLARKSMGHIYVSVHRFPKGQHSLYWKAARFQCVSTAVANELMRRTPSAVGRISVVPNFVSIGELPPVQCSQTNVNGRLKLLFVGRVHPEKGLHILLEALKYLPMQLRDKLELRIVGPFEAADDGGGVEYLTELQEAANELELPVHWDGPVYDELALSTIYRSADIFVYPSIAKTGEAFGLAPLEAMAHGTPAIVSSLECFAEYMKPGINGWTFSLGITEKDAVAALRLTMEAAMGDYSKGANHLRHAAQMTASDFSLSKVTDTLEKDIFSVICETRF